MEQTRVGFIGSGVVIVVIEVIKIGQSIYGFECVHQVLTRLMEVAAA